MTLQHIAASVRWTAATGWYLQNDAEHAPIGAVGVSIVERPYGLRLNIGFASTAGKVGSITLQPDNALLRAGYCAGGAECGLSSVDFELFRQFDIQGQVRWDGARFVIDYPSAHFPVTVENLGSGMVRIHHQAVSFAELLPSLSTRNGYYPGSKIGMFGADFFDIQFPVTTPDAYCACLFQRSGRSSVSPYAGYANADGNYWLTGTMQS